MTRQPEYKLVAQLGDHSPIEHGGYFVYEDLTGVYPTRGEVLEELYCDRSGRPYEEGTMFSVHRIDLEPCTYTPKTQEDRDEFQDVDLIPYPKGILSDNKYHPLFECWFGDKLEDLAEFAGMDVDELIRDFVRGSIPDKAGAWKLVGEYFGFDNLDVDPLILTRAEVEKRYEGDL